MSTSLMRSPIGSRTLIDRYHLDISSATVRNELSHLEEAELSYLAAYFCRARADRFRVSHVRG